VDRPNPIFTVGTELTGHEFHYSTVAEGRAAVQTAYGVEKGSGIGDRRDGIVQDEVLASYLHLHALGSPTWAAGLLAAARRYREKSGKADPDDRTTAGPS
jgi:cobyrinic acid a,c-diamide synthase